MTEILRAKVELVQQFITTKNIDLKESIRECIKKHGYDVREYQVVAVHQVIYAYLYEYKANVVLSASTGLGKSIIGIVVYDVMNALFKHAKAKSDKGYILIGSNSLVDQYEKDFKEVDGFLVVKGASNYDCLIHNDNDASSCMFSEYKRKKDKKKMNICMGCEYVRNRAMIDSSDLVVSNYQYYTTMQLFAKGMEKRLISIMDEAHLFSDVFVGFCSFDYDIALINTFLNYTKKFYLEAEFKLDFEHLIDDIRKITTNNYNTQIDKFVDVLSKFKKELKYIVDDMMGSDDSEVIKYLKVMTKINRIVASIELYKEESFEFVTDVLKAEDKKSKIGISLRPIFIAGMYENMECSDFSLFMSGTIDQTTVDIEIGLSDYKLIKLDPVFPPEHKKLTFVNYASLNAKTLKQDGVTEGMIENIVDIIEEHKDQKGLILVNSFYMSNIIENSMLKKFIERGLHIKIFNQIQGEHLDDVVQRFKAYTKPSILMSPSCFEGIDLKGKYGEYAILTVAPFEYYGDIRIKYIADKHRDLYNMKCLKKAIQAGGRIVRGVEEVGHMYIMDSRLYNLFNNRKNLWKNEFEVEVW